MAIIQNQQYRHTIYIHYETTNQSFLDMHYYLKDRGIQNNTFFLALVDKGLAGINPRDPHLNRAMKQRVLRECIINYWYFIREVVRIPIQGGTVGGGVPYKLHRGNLAYNFGAIRNWNMFLELPRQNFKTISAVVRYLWVFNFGTSNSEFMFINKKHSDSKMNLQRLKDLRKALPSYLQMDSAMGLDGKKIKVVDRVETLEHPLNANKIVTLPAARNKVLANSLGRGCTQPLQWYDEYAFIPHNSIIYLSATPAYKTAADNARSQNSPYGILITTTPGDLVTEEGQSAFDKKELATVFDENFYDMSEQQLIDLLGKNDNSNFVYMKFTYQQLGRDEKWFKEICIDMEKKWPDIRREVLLEWSKVSSNSPFRKEDLNIVKALIKNPIRTITLAHYYQMHIYEQMNTMNVPIVGVDVSGGYKRDSSAITIIDSRTTNVIATLNSNFISTGDLASVIYELVTKYLPRSVINVERNGGFGASVVSKLMKTSIKRNLYYEIKDKIIEERVNFGGTTIRSTQRTKVYGLDSSKNVRNNLMEILRERMEHHKDKFISPQIFNELETLEVKRNGKIEHSSTGHDDQIFSYLMALYVWYNGKDVMERYGIQKSSIRSDIDIQEGIDALEDMFTENIASELLADNNSSIEDQLKILQNNSKSFKQFTKGQFVKDQESLDILFSSKVAKDAYEKKYNLKLDENEGGIVNIPDSVFEDFYN